MNNPLIKGAVAEHWNYLNNDHTDETVRPIGLHELVYMILFFQYLASIFALHIREWRNIGQVWDLMQEHFNISIHVLSVSQFSARLTPTTPNFTNLMNISIVNTPKLKHDLRPRSDRV